MLTTIRMDVPKADQDALLDEATKACVAAAEAGGKIILDAYRSDLLGRAKTPGTYRSAQGSIEHFIHAYESVAKRTLLFRDRQGAYCVVGTAAATGSWRMASPQALWLEEGADGHSQPGNNGERYRYSDGVGTGIEAARHVLANIVAQQAAAVTATMQNVIREELAKHVL